MERRGAIKKSPVDKAFKKLKVGQKIPVTGAESYWRNRQAAFHKENPDLWVRIFKEKKKYFAERIV